MAVSDPPCVYPEAKFQEAVSSLIKDILAEQGEQFVVLENFGLDIAVFRESPATVQLFEVKVFAGQRPGAVGFGNGKGAGAQVDLLLCSDKSLCLFDGVVRWIYADATKNLGANRYALFTCALAKKAAMGGAVTRRKQNNLKISELRAHLVDWEHLRGQVQSFLLST